MQNLPRTSEELKNASRIVMPYFVLAGLFSLAINLLYLAPSLYMLQVYDRVIGSGSMSTLIALTVAIALAFAVQSILDKLRGSALIRCGIKLDRLVSGRLLQAMIERGVYPGSMRHGQSLRDFDTYRQFITSQGVHALLDAPWMPIYIAVTFVLHPTLGIVSVIGGVILIGLAIGNEFATKRPLQVANEIATRNYAFTESTLRNAEVVQAMGMQPGLTARWQEGRDQVMGYQAAASEGGAFWSSSIKFARQFLQSAMLGVGAYLVIEREMSVGAMFVGTLLMGRALAPIDIAVGSWRGFVMARQAYGRVSQMLALTPPRPVAMALPRPKGALSVDRLVYAIPGSDKMILKGISFDLEPGEALGLIGPSAAGKSTLARVLTGIWKPNSGSVRLDGADVYSWDRADFGLYVGYLPQDIALFAGSVRDNIARFREATPEQVVKAAQLAGVHEMILRLPNGYDTDIGDAGGILSGGQRQRLGLARAMFGDPAVLILDEPNSNLDSEGEQSLVNTLSEFKANGTTIVVIAHRPSVLAMVDKIMMIRDGQVEMMGPRTDVLARLTNNVVRPVAFAGNSGKEG
jgi:PrtD family type I secretion system ABC transporter